MADKPAGSVEQSEQICLFALRQCGTLAMTTGAGLDIYLVCWLSCLKRLKAQGGIFRHLPLSSEYSVSLTHVCVLYKHRGLGGTPAGRYCEGGYPQFSLFSEISLTQSLSDLNAVTQVQLAATLSLLSGVLSKRGAVKVQTPHRPHKLSEDIQGLWLESPALLCLFGLVPLPVIAYLWNLPKLFYIPIYARAIAVCSYKGQCVQT